MLTIILESLDDIVVVIIMLYLCFGPCTAFYFYVLLTNDYSSALFYALCAILCLGNFLHVQALPPKGELPMERKTVHDFLLRIVWRWQGNMSQDKDIDCLPGC